MDSLLCLKNNVRRKWYIPGPMFASFSFINVFSVVDTENGMKNMVEIAVALRIVQLLYKECASSKHNISIAVLSPYPAQVEFLQQKLENHYQNNEFFKVKAGFVHNYHQGEVDVMVISTVGSSTNLNNHNLCFTWARHCLWVLGDERMHVKGGSIWESLIVDAKNHGCFFQAGEHKDLAKVIVEVNKDLCQLDELVTGDTTLFRNTTWKVLFSSMFSTSFSKIESLETKKLVLLMLLKLSTGWRPKGSSTTASVCVSPYYDLMKEFKVRGLHLICTIDLVKDTQVLKVWDILPFHEIEELVKRLEGIIGMYTQEYIDHCKTRCVQRGFEFPIEWPVTSEIIQYKAHGNRCEQVFRNGVNEKVNVRESLILMKFYSLSTGAVNNMISGCDGGELGLPFELTAQEKNVVSFDKSSFILGRSGTGKSTVLTMKLFQNEQLHHLACEGSHQVTDKNEDVKQDVLHQLFVTLSPKLCFAVKQHVGEWKRLTCGGSSSSFSQNKPVWIDDINKVMSYEDISDNFIQLPQSAYPLIITFHIFLLMLDGTVGTSYFIKFPCVRQQLNCGNQTSTSRFVFLEEYMRSNDVTYGRFFSFYWPHFNNKLTKNLDPSSVYTEIMSVIKGGLTAGKTLNGILPKDEYVALCNSRISIFDAQKRDVIYSIFLQYEKKKVENGNFDLADLVNDLHQRLEFEGYKGDSFDYVYIDEVQDLSMSQIMLFKYVCKNVHEGFTFAGDTAQAIAKGIGFRFEDIRSLFFRKFLLKHEKGQISNIFQLSENFRTHAGVLNLAQSVIDLLCHFFPLFIDALTPETSQISGEPPILLEIDMNNNAIKFIFEREVESSQQFTGFGANQVVLVRDESLKEKVIDIVGKNAIVLTILESKGLEFQDVLLYDFFATSSFSNEWRIVDEYMKEKKILNSPSTAFCSIFDMEKHIVLCSGLKQLYVAITRTRQRLWICETTGFSHPIYNYWKKLSLVQVKHLSDSFADKMQIRSSKDEWRSRGIKLFYENNFRMAHMCFLNAGDKYSETLAKAYDLRAIADNTRRSQLERRNLFKEAAELFKSIGKKELAAECLYKIEDYRTAGDIYMSESTWEKAGNCYCLAKCYELAVEVYEKAGAFAKCLSACIDGELFDIGFDLIGRWGGFGSANNFKNMMMFFRSFHSKDKLRKFFTKNGWFDELISLEKEWGNFEEAAKVARLKPDPVLEADLLHTCGLHKESSLIILWHVFSNSSIFQITDDQFTHKDEMLKKAISIAKSDDNVIFYQFVCTEVKILSEGKTEEELLKKAFDFIHCYKENALAMKLQMVKTTHEINEIEKDVIHRMSSFFKSVNRLREFLLLLETRGKFLEAARIHDEDEHPIESALNRLWYIFFGSLWACGRRAWPLKDFKAKKELLDDAYKYVDHLPDLHYSAILVRTELSVLSGAEISLSDMWMRFRETARRKRSLRINFVISRRILDVYLRSRLEDVLLEKENFVTVEGLVYMWNYWKELIWELIEWSEGGNASEIYDDFISNYFGVRKCFGDNNSNYIVLDTKAHWVKEVNPFMVKNGYIHAREFTSMVSQYWCSELLFVAEKVLTKLQSLHAYSSTVENFSMLQQMKIITSLFKFAKSLQKCKFPFSSSRTSQILTQSLELCMDQFLSNVFHINWKIAQSKEMLSLRGNKTFLSMLEEAVNINSKSLTCGKLGIIAMISLESKLIGLNDDTKRELRFSPSWRALFDKLDGYQSSLKNGDLVTSLHNVVKEMFLTGWRISDECVSPACFLYIMERVLILSFCSRGYVYTTRSSCVEWLMYEEWDMFSNGDCDTSMKSIHDSLASMITEMLNSRDDLKEWVTRIKEDESFPILVLRLTVILSLICANYSEQHYYGHLSDLLEPAHFGSILPSAFRKALIKGIKKDSLVDAVAVACEEIENPLVVVSFTKDLSESPCQNAIFLNMMNLDFSRETLVEFLYRSRV